VDDFVAGLFVFGNPITERRRHKFRHMADIEITWGTAGESSAECASFFAAAFITDH